jgi:dihydrofolate reductase / thymidylate synthase
MFDIITAVDENNGIGKNNDIPWNLPTDLNNFKYLTYNSFIIMGKNTWNSLPKKPLPDRINIIISSTQKLDVNLNISIVKYNTNRIICSEYNIIYVFDSFQTAIDCIHSSDCNKKTFVIGGTQLYQEAINHPDCQTIHLTKIYKKYNCDRFFPKIPYTFKLYTVSDFNHDNDTYFRYYTYLNLDPIIQDYSLYQNNEEQEYLHLLRRIINEGEHKTNRTCIDTKSLCFEHLSYDLTDTFPILTTRKQYIRGIFEELLFYLRGQTNNEILVDKGVNVWTQNTTKEFLEKNNLDLQEGDMGPTYGFNFRHFGGDYIDCENKHNCGVDQLKELIHTLKTDPNSRRMIINLWDPKNNKKCALPSCMCFYQFTVSHNKYLNLQVYIRSSDFFLANNWNTCTAALFVHLLCNIDGINFVPGKLKIIMGDVHIYTNQLEAIQKCLYRIPKPFPKLVVNSKKTDITDFSFDDISLIGYEADKRVKVDMAV